tara:strand:+ start:565 stop:852 length:288 start_codon:yes stop_codon:yes gene_type:complete
MVNSFIDPKFPDSFSSTDDRYNKQFKSSNIPTDETLLLYEQTKIKLLYVQTKNDKYDKEIKRFLRDIDGYNEQMIKNMIKKGEQIYLKAIKDMLL